MLSKMVESIAYKQIKYLSINIDLLISTIYTMKVSNGYCSDSNAWQTAQEN